MPYTIADIIAAYYSYVFRAMTLPRCAASATLMDAADATLMLIYAMPDTPAPYATPNRDPP